MGTAAAVVDITTNIVINVIVANYATDPAPDGTFLIDVTDVLCSVGWIYDTATGTFTDPNSPAPITE